ncbi:hypothetical protein Scep_008058 [Stephania cephalantha]|uniref:Alpha/beta-Hydrolases superfamily protein n=1 Tax=Stephania cephalantha TaxID=152367 RepID=A0AAP0KAZ8_9MAGN
MGDLCIDEEVSPALSTVLYSDASSMSFLERLVFRLLGDDFLFHIVTLASCISSQFVCFVEDLVFRDIDECCGYPAVPTSEQHCRSSYGRNFQYVHDDCSASSFRPSDAGTNTIHPIGEKMMNLVEKFIVNTTSEIAACYSFWDNPSFFQGLMLPLCGLRFAWKLTFTFWRCTFFHVRCTQVQIRRFLSRLKTTLHGSSDDIGWLQHAPGMPPVEDGTCRFIELLQEIRRGAHRLPNSFVYLLIPGLFSNHSPLYFVNTKRFFSKMGLACHIAKIHSEAAVEHNAWELKHYIEELYWGSGKLIMLLGHSKGGVDAAAALSIYSSDLKDKVAGLILVQSPYGGTPIASDILRKGQIADKETRKIMEFLICKLIKGDIRALEDLTYEKRKKFIMEHKLPKSIPIISFHSEARVAPGVLSTMTHIAHAELPWLPLPNFCQDPDSFQAGCKVPVIIPLAAAMAVSALHLQLRYGEASDGLVTCRDAEVPGSVVVHPERKLDHAWMVYSTWRKDYGEPEACEMCEALLSLLVEMRQKQELWSTSLN